MYDLPTIDELLLATEKLALAMSDVDGIDATFRLGADPNQEKYPDVDLERVGATLLFAADVARVAEELTHFASGIASNVEAIYRGDAARDRTESDRSLELLAEWHRESLAA